MDLLLSRSVPSLQFPQQPKECSFSFQLCGKGKRGDWISNLRRKQGGDRIGFGEQIPVIILEAQRNWSWPYKHGLGFEGRYSHT